MINKWLIEDTEIKGARVVIDLAPSSNKNARPANKLRATSITIHETGNTKKGADAKAHGSYLKGVTKPISWHFTVDDKEIRQHIPVNENTWHAGDGTTTNGGNMTSISIEICVNEDGDFQKAKENAKKLVQYLMYELEITLVVPHRHWSGKQCPQRILVEGWDKFYKWLLDREQINEVEQIKAERDYWKKAVYDLLNLAEKATGGF